MKATLPQHIKLDEREHVEKPLLDQLAGLGWEVIDLTDMKQTPADTHRESFTEVVMPPVLRERLYIQSYPSACGCPITARAGLRSTGWGASWRRASSSGIGVACTGGRVVSPSIWIRPTTRRTAPSSSRSSMGPMAAGVICRCSHS